jgi:hypothetical protein
MIAERAKKRIRDYYVDPANDGTRRLFDWAAKQNFHKETTVDQIEQGADLDRAWVIYAMKELAQLGFGKFVVGRRGNDSRMIWKVNLGDLGRYAQGSNVEFDEPELASGPPQTSAEPAAQEIVHFYQLRPELRLSLKLPLDLTPGEARRLADFILSLPFEDAKPKQEQERK